MSYYWHFRLVRVDIILKKSLHTSEIEIYWRHIVEFVDTSSMSILYMTLSTRFCRHCWRCASLMRINFQSVLSQNVVCIRLLWHVIRYSLVIISKEILQKNQNRRFSYIFNIQTTVPYVIIGLKIMTHIDCVTTPIPAASTPVRH